MASANLPSFNCLWYEPTDRKRSHLECHKHTGSPYINHNPDRNFHKNAKANFQPNPDRSTCRQACIRYFY
jgi:hypothetical protein